MHFLRFNNYRLDQNGYEIDELDTSNLPEINVNKYSLARSDGSVLTSKYYGEKIVKANGRINAADRYDMEQKLDTLKTKLSPINKPLDVEVIGEIRRYNATVISFSTKVSGYSCFFEVSFSCDSFSETLNDINMGIATPITSNIVSTNLTYNGSINATPVIDLTIVGINDYFNAQYIELSNGQLEDRLRLTRVFNWGDRYVINSNTKKVELYQSSTTELDGCETHTTWTGSHTLSTNSTNQIQGGAAVEQDMAGAAATLTFSRLNGISYDLDTTSGKVIIPIFLPTPTAGAIASVSFYAGSDATLTTNHVYWTKTTQFDGSALATNSWNFIEIDLSATPTGTSGTAVRTAIISIGINVNGTSAAMRLENVLLDYISLYKPSVVPQEIDYEGTFVELENGLNTVLYKDSFTRRNITISGTYKNRYI